MTGPGTSADGRPERRRIDERLIVSGTVLDSIVEARRRRIPEMQERFGHLRQADLPPSERSLTEALRTRSGASAAPQPALIMECKAASPSRGTLRSAYDPAALARDLETLLRSGYALGSMSALDMFPHTHHFETIAVLDRS